jgi:Txe/YoeB family toxin of Txe-Axe toxin-antitoxin module
MDKIVRIEKTVHYYLLDFKFNIDFKPNDGDSFREIFRIIVALSTKKSTIRYQRFGEKSIFIQDIKFIPNDKQILGKLRCVRTDLLPEIMNTKTDEARGIEALEEEGLVETTHFVIDYSKKNKILAIEYNQFGAKITDFVQYIQNIGTAKKAISVLGYTPIIKNELSQYSRRINRTSEFIVKIHKDNVEKIKNLDTGLYTALKASLEQFESDYALIDLKFDYRQRKETSKINKSIFNVIRSLIKKPEKTELFNTLTVKAEDEDKNNRLEVFDLLVDKVKSKIKVEKQPRYRTIISEDLYQKIQSEIIRKKI